MANHKSSLKRIRQTEKRNLLNRYYGKNMRSAVRSLRAMTDKNEALAKFPEVQKMLDNIEELKQQIEHEYQKHETLI